MNIIQHVPWPKWNKYAFQVWMKLTSVAIQTEIISFGGSRITLSFTLKLKGSLPQKSLKLMFKDCMFKRTYVHVWVHILVILSTLHLYLASQLYNTHSATCQVLHIYCITLQMKPCTSCSKKSCVLFNNCSHIHRGL